MRNKIILTLLVAIIVSIGFFRDSLFVNINYQLSYLFHNSDVNYLTDNYAFLKKLSYNQLYYGKWALTLLFAFIYYLLTIAIVFFGLKNKKVVKWTTLTYIVLFLVSALSYIIGMLANYPQTGYKFARIFMGLLQSPIILMILFPLFALGATKNSDS